MSSLKKTILHAAHRAMGARMTPFGDWDMPLHYGSQIDEHHAVRRHVGMFDVCHMTVVDLRGERVRDFLSYLLANDVAKLQIPGKALYSCMLKPDGGVIDDLIAYFMGENGFRLVVNAGTTEKDIAWLQAKAPDYAVEVSPRFDLGMIAVQGPQARDTAMPLMSDDLRHQVAELKPFHAATDGDWFVGRTGYTGEDGLEIIVPENQTESVWRQLAELGVQPCGLAARDTLRLEAGMNLYGHDMDERVTPLASGLGWTVAMKDDRPFIGREALQRQRDAGGIPRFIGLVLAGKGVLRDHQILFDDEREIGEITSGGFSPTLQRSIAMARVAADAGEHLTVDIRGKRWPVIQVKPPFVRNGEGCID